MGNTFLLSLKIYAVWILLLLLFVILGGMIFGGSNSLGFSDLANWDGRHFLDIARYSYGENVQYAFFPLYPIFINTISRITGLNFLWSGLLINLISTFGVIYIFLKLLLDLKFKNPVKILIYFLIFPTSFYLICTYSESLFLFFSLVTFFFAGRKKFLWASVFASLSVATRIAGVAVIAGLLVEILLSKTALREKIMVIVISSLGLLSYCLFLFFQTGNPLYFMISELSWERHITIPGFNILTIIQYIAYFGVRPESFTLFSDLLFTVFGIGMVIRSVKILKPSLFVYALTSILLPLTTSLLLSLPRFLIVIFPIFMAVSIIKNRVFHLCFIVVSLVLLFLYFNFFLRNIWVS